MRDDNGSVYTLLPTPFARNYALVYPGDEPDIEQTDGNFIAEYGSGNYTRSIRLRGTVPRKSGFDCFQLREDLVKPERSPCNDMEPRQASYNCASSIGDKLTCSNLV